MRPSFAYQPSLDGLRAVAVALVVVFHADLGFLTGGYVGVSVFFALSGFLITSLLVREVHDSGRVDVGAFIGRRARRLLPASAMCLIGVAVAARLGAFDGVTHLRRDLIGSALQVQNWVLVAADQSYTDLLLRDAGRPSPLEHYWSLAIEEQFYWIWPLAFGALAIALGARLRTGLATLFVVAALVAPAVALAWGPDAAYFATPARLAEMLVGAWLAVVMTPHHGRDAPRIRSWYAPVGLAVVIVVAVVAPADSAILYGGGFPVFALATTLLVAGLQRPGPVTSMLAAPVLVAVGRVSYGVYLFHWPVFVALDRERTGLDGPALFALRLAVTAVITVVSFRLLEQPVRRARWSLRPTLVAATASIFAVVAIGVAVVPTPDDEYWRLAGASDGLVVSAGRDGDPTTPEPTVAGSSPTETSTDSPSPMPPESDATTAGPGTVGPVPSPEPDGGDGAAAGSADEPPMSTSVLDRPVRILVVGDSTAQATGAGLLAWAEANPEIATVAVLARPGVGILRTGRVVGDESDAFVRAAEEIVDELLPIALEEFRPDVVLTMVTLRDLEDRVWSDDEGPLTIADPQFVQRLLDTYGRYNDVIRAVDATVVWVRPPPMNPRWRNDPNDFRGDSDQRARYERVLTSVTRAPRDGVELLDLREYAASVGLDTDRSARPDGVHWTLEAATALASAWLGPELVAIVAVGRGT